MTGYDYKMSHYLLKRKKRTWTPDQKRVAAASVGWRCQHCNQILNAAFECDHRIPLEQGGADDIRTNCDVLCSNCHSLKTQQERMERNRKARKKLEELQTLRHKDAQPPIDDNPPTFQSLEDLVMDDENPFRAFCFVRK